MFVIRMKLKHIITFIFLLMLLASFSSLNKKTPVGKTLILKKAEWLLGKWATDWKGGWLQESWERLNDSTYIGTSIFIKGTDTMSPETIRLEQHGNALFYMPIVRNQNDGKPITFKLTLIKVHELTFENPAHDFPQKIRYKQITANSMEAEISGAVKGIVHAELFKMARVK